VLQVAAFFIDPFGLFIVDAFIKELGQIESDNAVLPLVFFN
jgi:hypothetical protein